MLQFPAFGLVTAYGSGMAPILAAQNEQNLCFRTTADFIGSDYRPQLMAIPAEVGLPGVEARVMTLISEALADLAAQPNVASGWKPSALVLLTPGATSGFDEARSLALSQRLVEMLRHSGWLDPSRPIVQLRGARADSIEALRVASKLAIEGPVLLLAAESWACRDRLNTQMSAKKLFSNDAKWGIVPGEAALAALCMPWCPDHPLNGIGLLGLGFAQEPDPEHFDRDSNFSGLSDAGHEALKDFQDVQINDLISDWNNSRYKAAELSYAMLRLSSSFAKPPEPDYPALFYGDTGVGWLGPVLARITQAKNGAKLLALCGNDEDEKRGASLWYKATIA